MVHEELLARIAEIRAALAGPHADPARLQDDVQRLIALLAQNHEEIPVDLREAVEELQAEIVEAFYDNLPV